MNQLERLELLGKISKHLVKCANAHGRLSSVGEVKSATLNFQKFNLQADALIFPILGELSGGLSERFRPLIRNFSFSKTEYRREIFERLELINIFLKDAELETISAKACGISSSCVEARSKAGYPKGWACFDYSRVIDVNGTKIKLSKERFITVQVVARSFASGEPGITQETFFERAFNRDQPRDDSHRIKKTVKKIFYGGTGPIRVHG